MDRKGNETKQYRRFPFLSSTECGNACTLTQMSDNLIEFYMNDNCKNWISLAIQNKQNYKQ